MAKEISKVTIKAPIQKVWQALTSADWVKKWQFGSILETDWEEGHEIRFRTEWNGQTFAQWGKVLEYRPNDKLSYSLFAPKPGLEDKPEHYFKMTYLLTEEAEGTHLEIIKEDQKPDAPNAEKVEEENPVLNGLKSLLEEEN
ncbi:SRPBCC domain-containing protein [Marinilongibacter aquaticus]|uniref:SRPBCC family protein n=1 Tax=Marinilongibacter aquaticus TaxID=2975157 RepID=UPI0021BDA5C9|nr:SRPBCC family protein [Marinilongibacter aquaticus]UBM60304.1 SRPBCC domain-containing protein [Marinilongibacter aquaticus]